jgi:hypothetical protein
VDQTDVFPIRHKLRQ